MPDTDPAGDVADQGEADEDATETEIEPVSLDLIDRLTVKTAVLILPELRAMADAESTPDRIRFAAQRTIIAVCERVSRMCRRDLPAEKA